MNDESIYAVVLGLTTALAAGVAGSFGLMKRMTLAGDVVSHLALPGLGAAFLWKVILLTIGHTQLTDEHVYLQLGTPKPKRAMPDLLLDDIVVDDGTLIITRDGVTLRLMVQRAKGKMRSVPTLSSSAISLDIKKLEELKFKRAELEVIKLSSPCLAVISTFLTAVTASA